MELINKPWEPNPIESFKNVKVEDCHLTTPTMIFLDEFRNTKRLMHRTMFGSKPKQFWPYHCVRIKEQIKTSNEKKFKDFR